MQNSCIEKTVVYAGFWVRFAAFLIDSLIVGVLTLTARLVLAAGSSFFELFERDLKDGGFIITDNMYFHGLVNKNEKEIIID